MEISNGHNQEMTLSHSSASFLHNQQQEKKSKYKQDQGISCPRCESTNTKFCYYNNYSLSQPRYFCKGCRRYWTKGGMLRNVPVGGGCRKNKRPSSSNSISSPSSSSTKNITKPPSTAMAMPNLPLPKLSYEPNNLALAFHPVLLGNHNPNPNPSFLDILRGGAVEPASPNHRGAAGFQSLWHGFGSGGNDQRAMLLFNGGSDSTTAAASAATGVVVGNDDDGGGGGGGGENNAGVSLGLDTARDYWNSDVCSSSWHGLDNSSFL